MFKFKRTTLGITYSCVTTESAEHGDFSDSGWELEHRQYECGDLRYIRDSIGVRARARNDLTDWWESDWYVTDDRTGEERSDSAHIDGITPATWLRINRYLAKKPVLGGNKA